MYVMKRIFIRSTKWRTSKKRKSPSAGYQHGIVNSNIHAIVKREGLRGTLCLTFMEYLDYRYRQGSDDYVIPDAMAVCDRKYRKGSAYTGTPKFIVETLSPATALRDKTIKKISIRQPGRPGNGDHSILSAMTLDVSFLLFSASVPIAW